MKKANNIYYKNTTDFADLPKSLDQILGTHWVRYCVHDPAFWNVWPHLIFLVASSYYKTSSCPLSDEKGFIAQLTVKFVPGLEHREGTQN